MTMDIFLTLFDVAGIDDDKSIDGRCFIANSPEKETMDAAAQFVL